MVALKDRARLDEMEKEIEEYAGRAENYVNALKIEIKNRIALISAIKQAATHLEADRKDVKMVAHVSAEPTTIFIANTFYHELILKLIILGIQNVWSTRENVSKEAG